jgi:hypothetical protein
MAMTSFVNGRVSTDKFIDLASSMNWAPANCNTALNPIHLNLGNCWALTGHIPYMPLHYSSMEHGIWRQGYFESFTVLKKSRLCSEVSKAQTGWLSWAWQGSLATSDFVYKSVQAPRYFYFFGVIVTHFSCRHIPSSVNDGQNSPFSCQRHHPNKGLLGTDGARDPALEMAASCSRTG